jgi:hypothetical protein
MSAETECASCRCTVLVPDTNLGAFKQRYGGDLACGKPAHLICGDHYHAQMAEQAEALQRVHQDRERLREELASLARAVLRESRQRAEVLAACLKATEGEADPFGTHAG